MLSGKQEWNHNLYDPSPDSKRRETPHGNDTKLTEASNMITELEKARYEIMEDEELIKTVPTLHRT